MTAVNKLRNLKRMAAYYYNKWLIFIAFYRRYSRYSFTANRCVCFEQYEALIRKLYHSIEKGLSYKERRLGFGKDNIKTLISLLEKYVRDGYPIEADVYRSALCNLQEYVALHGEEHLPLIREIADAYRRLPGAPDASGGTASITREAIDQALKLDFDAFSGSRHSVREFSGDAVEVERILRAVEMAQRTPSVCNRQGWKVRLIADKGVMAAVLKNQNGNRGFGIGIDKLLIVTTDLRYFNRDREQYQAFVDGGLYSMNLLYGLHYQGLASISLSAALTPGQEKNVRKLAGIGDSEVLILFIGVGMYRETFNVPRSTRKKANVTIV